MTDREIIKAKELIKKLEEAYNFYYDVSRSMPYDIDTTIRETAICLEHSINEINRLKAEIEQYKDYNKKWIEKCDALKAEKEALIAGQETLQKYMAEQKAEIQAQRENIHNRKAEANRLNSKIRSLKAEIERLKVTLDVLLDERPEETTELKLNSKFETGDYAKIVANENGHGFKIDTIVKLEKHDRDYKAFVGNEFWWVTDEELAEIDDNNLLKEMVGEDK